MRYLNLFFLLLLFGCATTSHLSQPEPLPKQLEQHQFPVKWQQQVGQLTDDSIEAIQPAINEQQVFIANVNGNVAAIMLNTGKLLWKVKLPQQVLTGVGADKSLVAVTTKSGLVIALDPKNGKELWQHQLTALSLTTPVVSDGLVVISTFSQQLMVLEGSNGKLRWHNEMPNSKLRLSVTSIPFVDQEQIIVGSPGGFVNAYRLADGWQIWSKSLNQIGGMDEVQRLDDVGQALSVDEEHVFVSLYHSGIFALSRSDGETLWHIAQDNWQGVTHHNKYIVSADNDGQLWFIKADNGQIMWKQKKYLYRNWTLPLLQHKTIFVGDGSGMLASFTSKDGQLLTYQNICHSKIHLFNSSQPDQFLALCEAGQLMLIQAN